MALKPQASCVSCLPSGLGYAIIATHTHSCIHHRPNDANSIGSMCCKQALKSRVLAYNFTGGP